MAPCPAMGDGKARALLATTDLQALSATTAIHRNSFHEVLAHTYSWFHLDVSCAPRSLICRLYGSNEFFLLRCAWRFGSRVASKKPLFSHLFFSHNRDCRHARRSCSGPPLLGSGEFSSIVSFNDV